MTPKSSAMLAPPPPGLRRKRRSVALDAEAILAALPHPVIVLDAEERITELNLAAEQFLASSAGLLLGNRIEEHVPADHPMMGLIAKVRATGGSMAEYDVLLENPRIGTHLVTIEAAAIPEEPGHVVVAIRERSMASKIDLQLTHRGAARSVTAMAAMLAHEVKNPLSGIRGAAQLLEQNAGPDDCQLTRLIVDEADRICALVDRMEVFSDSRPIRREAVNIHQVLDHVRRVAQSGFARSVKFVERYDPSLPPVLGNRDQLVQIFLNLIKNAAEAAPGEGAEIIITTSFQHGMRLAVGGTNRRLDLPLVVSIQDNGEGIPEDLRDHLFDAFVTTKTNGTGLGLALVAKIVGDHGGIVEFDSQPRRTIFRVRLPMVVGGAEGEGTGAA
jgi:two-component system nitrogen regulation sensor histidine kinase GlnL